MADNSHVSISITTESILKVIFVLVAIAFLWMIHEIIALVFFTVVLASAFDPTVDYLQKYRIPRTLGILIIYVIFFSILAFVIIGIAKPLATEIRGIGQDLPSYYQSINENLQNLRNSSFLTPDRINTIQGGLDEMLVTLTRLASGNLMPVISTLFGGIVSLMLALVLTFYFTIQESAVKKFLIWFVPKGKEQETIGIVEKIQMKLGLWLRGQLLLSLIIFIITYVGLKILGVHYALVLAILAGFFELIPYLGPILSGVPAVFLTLVSPWGGWFKAALVLILYVLVQQLENHIVVPKVMSKTIGLNPIIVIISILIGAKVGGIVGALIAVPVASALMVYLDEKGYRKELVV